MMRSLFQLSGVLAIVGMLAGVSSSALGAEGLKDGDRIVFLGDSITQGGVGPKGYVTLVRDHFAHGDTKIEVIGAGISGNKVPDLERRLEKDVIAKKPSIVVIYIGINDVWHSQSGNGTSKENFDAGLRRIIESINKAGARVVLCTPSVIGEKTDGSNKFDAMLEEYSEISRKVAAETKSGMIDLRKAFLDELKKTNAKNAAQGLLTGDTVHLNDAGNQFVANQMVAGLTGTPVAVKEPAATKAPTGKVLRHIVLFQFKEGTKQEKIDEIVKHFNTLPSKIDSIIAFEGGTDNSPEKLAAGFTHGFVVSFKDEKGRDAYLPHKAHQEFVDLVKPHVEKVLVFDFWAN